MAIIKCYIQCRDKNTGNIGDFIGYDSIAFSPVFNDLVELFKWSNRYDIVTKTNHIECSPFTEALIFLGWQGGTVHDVKKELIKRVDSCPFCEGSCVVDDMPCLHHGFEDYLLQEIG